MRYYLHVIRPPLNETLVSKPMHLGCPHSTISANILASLIKGADKQVSTFSKEGKAMNIMQNTSSVVVMPIIIATRQLVVTA